ncbi:MAG: hypothetical protein IJS59_01890, partial [Bacteroidaceae bacterium]|nr:hypothetical protein [Bacteroidaceae bacterium]
NVVTGLFVCAKVVIIWLSTQTFCNFLSPKTENGCKLPSGRQYASDWQISLFFLAAMRGFAYFCTAICTQRL